MRIVSGIASAVAGIALAVLLLASGYFVCAAPPTTAMLASATSTENAATAFTHDDVVSVACATRDYSFGDHDIDALNRAIYDANVNAAARQAAGALTVAAGAPNLKGVAADDAAAIQAAFAQATDVYVYPADTISHLDDCYAIACAANVAVGVLAVVLVVCLIACGALVGRRRVGRVLQVAGIAVLALFVVCGIWAAIDFYGLFVVFHEVFFAQTGNWVFSETSLLICALPEDFWMGMGAVWLATSAIASILSILIGSALARRPKAGARGNASGNTRDNVRAATSAEPATDPSTTL